MAITICPRHRLALALAFFNPGWSRRRTSTEIPEPRMDGSIWAPIKVDMRRHRQGFQSSAPVQMSFCDGHPRDLPTSFCKNVPTSLRKRGRKLWRLSVTTEPTNPLPFLPPIPSSFSAGTERRQRSEAAFPWRLSLWARMTEPPRPLRRDAAELRLCFRLWLTLLQKQTGGGRFERTSNS